MAFRSIGAPSMSNAPIEIKELFKIFGPSAAKYVDAVKSGATKTQLGREHHLVLALNNISITMPAGKIQVVMGLSGSGKSTLIRHINRLIEPTSGSIIVDGSDILKMGEKEVRKPRRNQKAMVLQKCDLLTHQTVIEN